MNAGVGLYAKLRSGWALVFGVLLVGCAGVPGKSGSLGEIPWTMQYRPCTPGDAPDKTASRRKAQRDRDARAHLNASLPASAPAQPPARPAVEPARPRILLASNESTTVNPGSSGQTVQGYNVPGRDPNSEAPWEFFLGNAAHRLIAYMYGVNHPNSRAFYNNKSLFEILQNRGIGDPSRLLPQERNLRPDITDVTVLTAMYVFEIKPWNERGLQEGREEVQIYLAALNKAVAPSMTFTGGTDFRGEILVRFAQGQYIWRLEWQTTAPGVVQYRWTRSQQRFESEKAAYEAGQWVDLTKQEMRQYGGWVAQAVEGMVNRREQLAALSGAVGIVIDVAGNGAVSFFWGALFGRMNARPGVQQPPTQGGGQVLPFPAQTPPHAPPAQVPAAAMGL